MERGYRIPVDMNPAGTLLAAAVIALAAAGCGRQSSSKTVPVGDKSVMVDSESGTVKVFLVDASGKKTQLSDTGAELRMGWSLEKVDDGWLKLTTGAVGNFDIRNGVGGWDVVPEGTFVSPSRDRIVRLSESGSSVTASIGECVPPFTDYWLTSTVMLPDTRVQGLEVRWMGADEAQVVDASGKVLAILKHKETGRGDQFR